MGADQPNEKPKLRWLAWVGLQEPPADPDAWIPIAAGRVTDPKTGASEQAIAIVQALSEAGIQAHQQPYVLADSHGLAAALGVGGASASDRIRVAVLVHQRDQDRAKALIGDAHEPAPAAREMTEGRAALWLGGAIPPGT